jgi:hypothetical protein
MSTEFACGTFALISNDDASTRMNSREPFAIESFYLGLVLTTVTDVDQASHVQRSIFRETYSHATLIPRGHNAAIPKTAIYLALPAVEKAL